MNHDLFSAHVPKWKYVLSSQTDSVTCINNIIMVVFESPKKGFLLENYMTFKSGNKLKKVIYRKVKVSICYFSEDIKNKKAHGKNKV